MSAIDKCIEYVETFGYKENVMLAKQAAAELAALRAELEEYKKWNSAYSQQALRMTTEELSLRAELDKAQTENVAWEITANLYKAQLDEANKAVEEARETISIASECQWGWLNEPAKRWLTAHPAKEHE